jgi:drug/metabolite transporter (DMT)-like permease
MAVADSDRETRKSAIAALLLGAVLWGTVWFPYRLLYRAGLSPVVSAVLTDALAFALACLLWRKILAWRQPWLPLTLLALASGAANVGYIIGTVYGEVMRVMLLFYLAPLWTVMLAWLLLGERSGRAGLAVLVLSLLGAVVMLWRPKTGMPLPSTPADWIGLAAGFFFALSNVLVRRAGDIDNRLKSLAAFFGVAVVGFALVPFDPTPLQKLANIDALTLAIALATGVSLVVATRLVYFGITHLPANRAIVIMLFELVVAALAAWWLAGESMTVREWLGGALIVAASLLSGQLDARQGSSAVVVAVEREGNPLPP